MKIKLSKILGVGLALLMVFTLAFAVMPTKAQADEGNMRWLAQPLPGTGDAFGNVLLSDAIGVLPLGVTEIAVANDGMTMYAIMNSVLASTAAAPFALYKSIDAGQSWRAINLSVPIAVATWPASVLGNVAVAPDNPSVVAVSTRDATTAGGDIDTVFVSSSGGISWAPLPAIVEATAGDAGIQDLKIGPTRTDAILQREYLIAVADDAVGVIEGSLQIIGAAEIWGATGTAWIDIGGAAGIAAYDYMACDFSPEYLGQRTVVGIGATPAVGAVLFAYNTQTPVLLNSPAVPGDILNATPDDFNAAANDILCADIALSTDFEIATPGYDKVYCSITYNTAAPTGGVYRVEQGLPVGNLLANQAIRSISFAGDAWGGTLFAGDYIAQAAPAVVTRVRYTTQPVVNLPTWYPSRKPPTGTGGLAYVRVSPNFLTTQTLYCGTSSAAATPGGEGAFSVSIDAAISFDQEALIDSTLLAALDATRVNTLVQIDSIAYSPDGTTLFLATNDDDNTAGEVSLWKTATPPTPTSWVRIHCFTLNAAAATGVLTINRGLWADFPEIYFAESPTVALRFFVSQDGGALFFARTAPVIGQSIPAGGIAPAGPKELYVACGPGGPPPAITNIYKSTSGASGAWGPPAPANAGASIISVAVAPNADVLVGGIGATSRSTDGGTSFAPIAGNSGLPATGWFACLPDYMGNYPITYAWSLASNLSGATNNVYRIDVDTGTAWESLANPAAAGATPLVGFGQSNGALYAMTAGALALNGCDRTIMPTFAVGDMIWGVMNVPATAFPNGVSLGLTDVADSKVYTCFAGTNAPLAPELWAYGDFYATLNTTISTPASGDTIPIDPVTGRAVPLRLVWDPIGTGTGLANMYLAAIFPEAQGLPGAVFIPITGAALTPLPVPSAPSCTIWPVGAGAVAPDIAYTFVAGNTYGIMIVGLNQVSLDTNLVAAFDDRMISSWSDPVFIDIEAGSGIISPPHGGPLLNEPSLEATATGVDVGLSWAPMSGVTAYELIIATDAALTATVAGTPLTVDTTNFGTTLDFDVIYYYGVRATAPTSSVQATGTFTLAEPVEKYTCEYCGLTFDTRAELEAHIAAAHAPTTPLYIWIVIVIGAILVIAVIWLIFTTRRT